MILLQEPEPKVKELETEEANIEETAEGHETVWESENQVVEVSLNSVIGLTSSKTFKIFGFIGK